MLCVPPRGGCAFWGKGRGGGGGGGDGDEREDTRYVKSKLQQTASFIVVESLDVPPQHAQTHTHTHTYFLPTALILPKDSPGLTMRCQNSKSGRYRLNAASKLIG